VTHPSSKLLYPTKPNQIPSHFHRKLVTPLALFLLCINASKECWYNGAQHTPKCHRDAAAAAAEAPPQPTGYYRTFGNMDLDQNKLIALLKNVSR